MQFLSRGKRGNVYLDVRDGKTVVVKQKRPDSKALSTIQNEAHWLRVLNKHHIGPRLISADDASLVMEYIDGERFDTFYAAHQHAPRTKRIIRELFRQCRVMDTLRVNKEELHTPTKHIIIHDEKPVMIDFERCHHTLKPKNVTQLCQYLTRLGVPVDKNQLTTALKTYKHTYADTDYQAILRLFRLR